MRNTHLLSYGFFLVVGMLQPVIVWFSPIQKILAEGVLGRSDTAVFRFYGLAILLVIPISVAVAIVCGVYLAYMYALFSAVVLIFYAYTFTILHEPMPASDKLAEEGAKQGKGPTKYFGIWNSATGWAHTIPVPLEEALATMPTELQKAVGAFSDAGVNLAKLEGVRSIKITLEGDHFRIEIDFEPGKHASKKGKD